MKVWDGTFTNAKDISAMKHVLADKIYTRLQELELSQTAWSRKTETPDFRWQARQMLLSRIRRTPQHVPLEQYFRIFREMRLQLIASVEELANIE